MIYLLGASHIMALLGAVAPAEAATPAPQLGIAPPAFADWPVRDGLLPDRLKVASIYLGHTVPFWGPVLAEMQPGNVLGIADGFGALLASANADPDAAVLFLCIRGEEYFHVGMAGVDAPYDFVLPGRPDLAVVPGRAVVPLEAVEDQMRGQLARTLPIFTAIRRFCPHLRIVRLTPPPPTANEDVARWVAAHDEPPHATQGVPGTVRLKLWLLYDRLLGEALAGLNLPSLPVPPQALNADGTLRYEYMHDPVHGNARYGELVCAQMSALLEPALESHA